MRKALVAGAVVVASMAVAPAVGAVPPGLEKKGSEEGWFCGGDPAEIYGGSGRSAWVNGQRVMATVLHFEGVWTPVVGEPETELFHREWPAKAGETIECELPEFTETVPGEGSFTGSGYATIVVVG